MLILSVLISKYDVLVIPGSVLLILKPLQQISLVTSTTESCFQLRNHTTLLFLISYCFEIDSVKSSPVKLSSKKTPQGLLDVFFVLNVNYNWVNQFYTENKTKFKLYSLEHSLSLRFYD